MSSPACLYHNHGGRGLLEHVTNQLTKASHFTPQHKSYLRRATCSCDPGLLQNPPILLPLSALAPKGLDHVSASLARAEPLIAALVPLLTPKDGKDAPEIAHAKFRLLAVVYRLIKEPRGQTETEAQVPGAAPFGFTPEFLASEIEKKKPANQAPKEVVSEGVLALSQDHVGKFIGKGGKKLKALGLPSHLVVHLEDDRERERQEQRGRKPAPQEEERGTVKVFVKVKVLDLKPGKKERTPEKERDRGDAMRVDSESEDDNDTPKKRKRGGKSRKEREKKASVREKEKKKPQEEPKASSEEDARQRAKELKEATDAALAMLMAKAVLFTQQEKEQELKALEEEKRRQEERKKRRRDQKGGSSKGRSLGRKFRRTR